ncbi:MAG: hypothetical protein QME81_07725 [bacterium]|nr:hypothetical protein [bacterium]
MRQARYSFKAVVYLLLVSLFIVCLESAHHTCDQHYSPLGYCDPSDADNETEHFCPGCWWGQNGQAIAALAPDFTPAFLSCSAPLISFQFHFQSVVGLSSARAPPEN